MSFAIPRPALMLGLAGLLPFLYAALAGQEPRLELDLAPALLVAEVYGLVIFAYMSGVFWGFAVAGKKAAGDAGWRWLGLAVAPAVVMVLALVVEPGRQADLLLIGFPALLPIDFVFQRAGLAPRWWLALRLLLTAVVVACLWLAVSGAGEAL